MKFKNSTKTRLWPRITLRGVLILMTLFAMGAVCVRTLIVERYERQHALLTRLEGRGCFVSSHDVSDSWVRHLISDSKLKEITHINNTQSSAPVTDDDLEGIGFATEIEQLYLNGESVSDASLEEIGRIHNLSVLSLSGTHVSDAGLVHLSGLDHLCYLDLSHTAVTDNGLNHLSSLTYLGKLNLVGTDVTNSGVRRLERKLPQLEVYR